MSGEKPGLIEKATKTAATAAAVVMVVKSVASATWGENGQLQTVKVFGLPVFDRRRMEARRARRRAKG